MCSGSWVGLSGGSCGRGNTGRALAPPRTAPPIPPGIVTQQPEYAGSIPGEDASTRKPGIGRTMTTRSDNGRWAAASLVVLLLAARPGAVLPGAGPARALPADDSVLQAPVPIEGFALLDPRTLQGSPRLQLAPYARERADTASRGVVSPGDARRTALRTPCEGAAKENAAISRYEVRHVYRL